MNIGIIVYSRTGHTLFVAQKLEEQLSALDHKVILEQLKTFGPEKLSAMTAELVSKPEIGLYDALVLASPVNGGRISAPMYSFIEQTPSLQGKQVVFLVTHFFPRGWGAKQTIQMMQDACAPKGAVIRGAGNVQWSIFRPGRHVQAIVDNLSLLL